MDHNLRRNLNNKDLIRCFLLKGIIRGTPPTQTNNTPNTNTTTTTSASDFEILQEQKVLLDIDQDALMNIKDSDIEDLTQE